MLNKLIFIFKYVYIQIFFLLDKKKLKLKNTQGMLMLRFFNAELVLKPEGN